MRSTHVFAAALVATALLAGCKGDEKVAQNQSQTSVESSAPSERHMTLPSGTSLEISLSTPLSSETATVGTAWSGSTRSGATVDGQEVIPAGSEVSGTVIGVTPAKKGDRAMLDLGLTSVTVDGENYRVHGSTEAVIAGSTRARNLGAIGAATAAGALAGQAIGGSTKGTVIGAVVGGTAATGVVSQTKGWQVVLKQGTSLTFTTSESVAVRSL